MAFENPCYVSNFTFNHPLQSVLPANPSQDSRNATYQGSNPYGYSNMGYGNDYGGYQQHFKHTQSLYSSNFSPHQPWQARNLQFVPYAYQPSEFTMAFPNFSTAGVVLEGVGFFSNNQTASFYGTGMMRTNCKSEDINIPVQHQGSPINHVMDGPFPIDFPVEKSENYNGTGTIYYGLQVTSSSHEVCALETPILGNVIAGNRDEGAMKLVVADGLNGNGVILNEIECSVPTSPFSANSKINLPNPKHKLLDEMPTSEVMGPFDKLSPISKNLVEAEQLENRVMANSEPKSKIFSTPEVLLEGKILEETEPWKGEECPAPEMLMEPIMSPPSSAYCLKVNVADLSSWMIVIPQEQKSQATSSDTGRAADSITIANEEIDLNIIEGNDEMVIQEHIPTIETRAKDMDTRKHAEVEPLVMIVDAQGALIGKDKAVGVEKESANIEIEMNTERYEPIDRGKECTTEGPEQVPGKPNVFKKAYSVPDSTNCVSETTILEALQTFMMLQLIQITQKN